MKQLRFGSVTLFPEQRFDAAFPVAVWFSGLWLYLKSFLYVCYLYNLGIEPPPYGPGALLEIAYFGLAAFPSFFLAMALWNRKESSVVPALLFLAVDTPFLLYHVIRLGQMGFLDSGLTRIVEFGSLALNGIAIGLLINYAFTRRAKVIAKDEK